MKTFLRTAGLLTVFGLSAVAPAQQFDTIAFESFDYATGTPLGDLNGGSGWVAPWYSGPTLDHALVATPGYDSVGERLQTSINNGGSFRLLDAAGFENFTENQQFGKDNTTLWVSFWAQRDPSSDDDYGGLSLFVQFDGEKVFLGSPSQTSEWGLQDVGGGFLPAETVSGTQDVVLARLVYRFDFLPGDERVRMWIDPSVPHPTTAPDLDTTVTDFRVNEIRLESGNSVVQTGFNFDEISIELESDRPDFTITNLIAGQSSNWSITNMTPGNTVRIGYSTVGAGPTTTPFGVIALSPPISELPQQTVDVNGEVNLSVPIPGNAAGITLYAQAGEFTSPTTVRLSNALAEVVQ